MLDGVLSILEWQGGQQEALDQAEGTYMSLVAGTLGGYLRQLGETEPEWAAHLLALLATADVVTLRRVVLGPDTSSRILWGHPGRCDNRDLSTYLADVLQAVPAQPNEVGLVVDSDSSSALCFDYSTLRDGGMRLERYSDLWARELALSRLEAAMRGIHAMDPGVAAFVQRFTLVANVLVDSETPKFTSGSTSQYIGRSLFCNAHLPGVDAELMAESLVHEAIHSLLYMHEVCERWILDEAVISREAIVQSPWSGAMLLLRPFLQACFVWFGLTRFWSRAQHSSSFRPERIEARLATARGGFLKGPLDERIGGYVPNVDPTVIELVRAMQEIVVAGAQTEAKAATSA
jgi:hypothetical protein